MYSNFFSLVTFLEALLILIVGDIYLLCIFQPLYCSQKIKRYVRG